MKRLLTIPLLLTVAACGPRPEVGLPPADKLVCPGEPAIPSEPVTDEKNTDYLKALRNAHLGCKADVDWMRTWFKTK